MATESRGICTVPAEGVDEEQGPDSPPEPLPADCGVDHGTDADAYARTLSGEFGSDHLYLSDNDGRTFGADLWEVEAVADALPAPAEDTGEAPEAVVVGHSDTVGLTAALRAADLLVETGTVGIEEFDDHLLHEDDGQAELIRDSLERSGTHALNLVLDALSRVE